VARDGRIQFAGPQARAFGYEPEELVGQPVEVLVPERMREVHRGNRARFAAAPATRSMGAGLPLYARCRDGSEIPVEVSLGPAQNGATTVIVVNVSARRELETRLRQGEKLEAVGRLAGGVAHDFNNLLTVISGYGDLVRQRLGDGAAANDLAEVLRAAERASRLTGQLLAFSRQQVLQLADLQLIEVVEDTLPMLNRLIGEDIRVVLLTAATVPLVHADRGQLEQVIVNLAINGRDAMPTGGTLTIEVQSRELDASFTAEHPGLRPGLFVCLTVTDTGVGIAPDALANIFEPFFTTKEVGHGTGLGLATVHGIVTQSGGHVHAYSEQGFGTSFKVYLPAAERSAAGSRTISSDPAYPGGGDETLLVCEDEAGVRVLITRVLEQAGYTVLAAADPNEALRIAADSSLHIDALVSDVVMPGMPGPELAERLLKARPGLRTLFISGYTADTVRSRGGLPASSAFLEKPFAMDHLVREVRSLLDRARRPA
jgi:PAS domain S-box-containing protein